MGMFDSDEFDCHPADEEPRKTGGSKRHNTQHTQAKMPTLEECQKEVQSHIWAGGFVGTSTNITEVVYKFICRHIGCA
jgi:hypothetical protein